MAQRVVVFVTYGSFGDVNPLLAVAQRLARVRPVRFVSNESYRAHVEAAGVPFVGAGTVEEQAACRETASSSGRSMAGLMTQFRHHVGRNIPRLAAYLEGCVRAGEAPLVVTHGTTNPAFPACESLDLPVVRAFYAPSHLPLHREDFLLEQTFSGCPPWRARWVRYPPHALRIRLQGPPHAREEYNRLRAEAGIGPSLPPYRQWLHRMAGRRPLALRVVAEILLTPAWFAEPLGPELRHLRCTGFPFLAEAPKDEDDDAGLDAFIARHGPPVVFTPGTGVEDMKEFCRPLESACRKIGAPGILLARHGHEAFRDLQRVLDHPVRHLEHADLARLLPKAKLLVHTGGIGTIAQAVRAGVPQILHPTVNDQPRNALRVMMNGLGGVLGGDAYTGAGLARLYRDLVESPLHRECLAHYAAQVRDEDGAQSAAAFLAELPVDPPAARAAGVVARGPAAVPGTGPS